MKLGHIALPVTTLLILAALLSIAIDTGGDAAPPTEAPVPVLSVTVTAAEWSLLPVRVPATGNVTAWQESSVGAEVDGLRLEEVQVNVGDAVRRGQLLARFNTDVVTAELAEAEAAVAQAEAQAGEAETNAQRARRLDGSGALSAQQASQYAAAAVTARARVRAMRAAAQRSRLRLAQTRVLAPGHGIVTSRSATVGAVVPAGQELFRVIADGRLEWRAVVGLSDMTMLAPGQQAEITVQGHGAVHGTLRMLAPTIDVQTHSGLAYVDLPRDSALRAGAFARGHFAVRDTPALTVPQSAVLLKDGFHYVMRVGPGSTVLMRKVSVGRRVGERVEITAGLAESERVITSGLGFLSEGDTVRVVSEPRAGQHGTQDMPAAARSRVAASSGGES